MKSLCMSLALVSILSLTSMAHGTHYYKSKGYFGYGIYDSPYVFSTYRNYGSPEIYLKGYGRQDYADRYYLKHNLYKFRWYRPFGYYRSPHFYLKGYSRHYYEKQHYISHKPYKVIRQRPDIYRDGYRFKSYGSGRFYRSPRHGGYWRR